MVEGVEAFYQQIAESMIEAIPEKWSSAVFEAMFFPDGSTYEAEFTRKFDGKVRSFLPKDGGDRAFRQLRKKFKDAGKPLWGKARFDLRPDGTFNMKWGYEDCDEEGYLKFNEEAEFQRQEARSLRVTQN